MMHVKYNAWYKLDSQLIDVICNTPAQNEDHQGKNVCYFINC